MRAGIIAEILSLIASYSTGENWDNITPSQSFRKGVSGQFFNACRYEIFRESPLNCGQCRVVRIQSREPVAAQCRIYAEVVGSTAPEVLAEDETTAWLAATN